MDSFFQKRVYVAIVAGILTLSAYGQSADDVVKRHLESIGTLDARTKASNRLATGQAEFTVKMPELKVSGRALMASDGRDLMFLSNFGTTQYQYEKVGLFAHKPTLPFISQGLRSPLGSFLQVNSGILTERLFGGSIFSTWRLGDVSEIVFKNAGKKTINGRQTVVLKAIAKNALSGDSSIKLYFDAESFNHVRTEYLQTIGQKEFQPIRTFGGNSGENVNLFVEEFSDHHRAGELTLPHKYSAVLSLSEGAGTKEFRWGFTVDEYKFQPFPEGFFKF